MVDNHRNPYEMQRAEVIANIKRDIDTLSHKMVEYEAPIATLSSEIAALKDPSESDQVAQLESLKQALRKLSWDKEKKETELREVEDKVLGNGVTVYD